MRIVAILLIGLGLSSLSAATSAQAPLFDLESIRDPATLDIEVIQDWHVDTVNGSTRQKLIEITVAEWWEGAVVRVPVRIIVPLEADASGFAITGGSRWSELQEDMSTGDGSTAGAALSQGAASVHTIVQPLAITPGASEYEFESHERWAATGDGRYTTIWLWAMTHMRAVTAVLEEEIVHEGPIIGWGTSKNGGAPAAALMNDDRYTGLFAEEASAYYSPLDRRDPDTVDAIEQQNAWFFAGLDSGKLDPGEHSRRFYHDSIYNNPLILYITLLEDAGWSPESVRGFAANLWSQCALTAAWPELQRRGVEIFFATGSHDWVADDLAWGAENHPEVAHYYRINGGHGQGPDPLLVTSAARLTRLNFIERHFGAPHDLMAQPVCGYQVHDGVLEVEVTFASGPQPDAGQLVWMDDRHLGGSAPYLWREYGPDNVVDLLFDASTETWRAHVTLPEDLESLDVFTDHRRYIASADRDSFISSPYTRIILDQTGMPSDLDGDGLVSGSDLTILLGAWGSCRPEEACPGDIDGDGLVNGADLTLMLGAWTQTG
ncbi:MAG: hypothetical protein P8J45_08240 [Phycisphaerales bacterium]|nr:hypothetical protein [Phycisphaerales bacterium]